MSNDITVTFLGTTSGGGPTETRNCSSLVLDPLSDGSLWMVDCAEGTARQVATQPWHDSRRIKLTRLTKIFITHMHADHTMGLLPLLRNVLGIPRLRPPFREPDDPPRVEVYGPRGLRRLLRTLCAATNTNTDTRYAVHELLFPGEEPDVNAPESSLTSGPPAKNSVGWNEHVECEAPGFNFACDADGFWRGIVDTPIAGSHGRRRLVVDAGPIEHRDPCLGFVFREVVDPDVPSERERPPRTLVILGDTYDASGILPLLSSPSRPLDMRFPSSDPLLTDATPPMPARITLLIHEATDACIPRSIDTQERTGRNRTPQSVTETAVARGHSTPAMAGAFARACGAERLVLNHIGARFPAPRGPEDTFRVMCMAEIERQAATTWAPPPGGFVQAAYDFMRVTIPPYPSPVELEMEGLIVQEVEAFKEVNQLNKSQNKVDARDAGPPPPTGPRAGAYLSTDANLNRKRERVLSERAHGASDIGRDAKRNMSTYAGSSAYAARDQAYYENGRAREDRGARYEREDRRDNGGRRGGHWREPREEYRPRRRD
ncbi:Zinc phosphodiesterase ELAC protein [Sparassis crispa]|uniref:Zinc phosphodiesterase ELAC protein n=1 Tax=Sparassis crispa TaxID=139825 RepID=A0A401GV84_9APHY|nr:Zinc phosphodiesterase ELAC protein [Sparassis crispa]GBE86099.1 Zinc phosphodiesterase ELAC protein [Sparassis crispa]